MATDSIQSSRRKRFTLRTWHVVAAIVALIIIVVIAVSSFFVWNRWNRFDDASDIQGTWYVYGTSVPIEITSDQLDFNADTSYRYELDPTDKTITFKLGNMDGLAHYCFFEDRQVLLIIDGKDFTRWGTATDDLIFSLKSMAELSMGRIPLYPEEEDVIVLSRTPDKHGWGTYSYAYKNPKDDPKAAKDDQDNTDDKQEPTEEAAGDQGQDGESSSNLNEGQHRADDPFTYVSDILMTTEGA